MRTGPPEKIPRAVVDANVLVSAWMPARTDKGLREQNLPAAAVLAALELGQVQLLYSRGIREEYRRVLHHRLLRIPQKVINLRLSELLARGHWVEPQAAPAEVVQQFQDADDLVYLETALGGQADFIITSNGCHFTASPVQVVSPADLPGALAPEAAVRESLLARGLRWLRGLLVRGQMQEE